MKSGSLYCNYEDAFRCYDDFRQPCGLKEIFHILKRVSSRGDSILVLEGGFGTGAYTYHLAKSNCRIVGFEASEEGTLRAKKRLSAFNNVHLGRGNILEVPVKDGSVDVYFVSQVLHHLDADPEFPNLNVFLQEAYRVLKKNGFLIIHTCDPLQLDPYNGSYWHYEFIPTAAKQMQQKYIPIDVLRSRLENSGFRNVEVQKSSGRIFEEKYYKDPTVLLQEEFWASDSAFSLVSDEEKLTAQIKLNKAINDGSIKEIMGKHIARAEEIGESLIVSAQKAA